MPTRQEQLEELIQQKVEERIRPWRRVLPPDIVEKMRKIADDYYRHHPVAERVLGAMVDAAACEQSGRYAIVDFDTPPDPVGSKQGA